MGNSNSAVLNIEVDPVQALLQSTSFLPVGCGFRPTDDELIVYLKKKINNSLTPLDKLMIPELEVYRLCPTDLPSKSPFPPESNVWYFFSPKDRRYPGGRRQVRANDQGNWNVTGVDQQITDPLGSPQEVIGKRRTFVFYTRSGRGSRSRTVWTIYEYATTNEDDAYVVCRLVKKPEETLVATRRRARNEGESSGSFPAEISYGVAGSDLPAAIDASPGGTDTQLASGNGDPVANYGVEEEEVQVDLIRAMIDELFNEQGTSYLSPPAAQPMPNDTELIDDTSLSAYLTGMNMVSDINSPGEEHSVLNLWNGPEENEATLGGILGQPMPNNVQLAEETSFEVLNRVNSPRTDEVNGWLLDEPVVQSD